MNLYLLFLHGKRKNKPNTHFHLGNIFKETNSAMFHVILTSVGFMVSNLDQDFLVLCINYHQHISFCQTLVKQIQWPSPFMTETE